MATCATDDPARRSEQASGQAPGGLLFSDPGTNSDPDVHNGKVSKTASHLTVLLAEYLADTIASLMRSILTHGSKILFDTDTEPLLSPSCWMLPLYKELLNSAFRNRPSAEGQY